MPSEEDSDAWQKYLKKWDTIVSAVKELDASEQKAYVRMVDATRWKRLRAYQALHTSAHASVLSSVGLSSRWSMIRSHVSVGNSGSIE